VHLSFPGHAEATQYYRALDISRAVAGVSYRANGIAYQREFFAGHPDQVIVGRLTADKPGAYTGSFSLSGMHDAAHVQELLLGFVGIMTWCLWAGMSLWLAAAVWLIYLLITCVVLTRGVSQGGLLITETSFRPGDVVGLVVAKHSLGDGNLAALSMLNAVFFRDTRGLFLALFMDAQQMAGWD